MSSRPDDSGEVPTTEAALPRWIAMLRRWKRNDDERGSPVVAAIRRPRSLINAAACFLSKRTQRLDRDQHKVCRRKRLVLGSLPWFSLRGHGGTYFQNPPTNIRPKYLSPNLNVNRAVCHIFNQSDYSVSVLQDIELTINWAYTVDRRPGD